MIRVVTLVKICCGGFNILTPVMTRIVVGKSTEHANHIRMCTVPARGELLC